MILHLTGWNLMPHFLAQQPRWSISSWSFTVSSVPLISRYGIWLYQFLIIAYLFSFLKRRGSVLALHETSWVRQCPLLSGLYWLLPQTNLWICRQRKTSKTSSWDYGTYHIVDHRRFRRRLLRIRTVWPEPSLFAHMKYGNQTSSTTGWLDEWVYGGRIVPYLMAWLI